MTGLPLRHVHQNILVGHGDARAALYRVSTISYPFMAVADKREWLRRLARLAFAAEADLSLWRVTRAYPAEDYVAQADGMLDERHQARDAWRSYLHGHKERLREMRSFVPEVYLAVSLRAAAPASLGSGLLHGLDRAPAGSRRCSGWRTRRRSRSPSSRRSSPRRSGPFAGRRDACRYAARRRARCSGCCVGRRAGGWASRTSTRIGCRTRSSSRPPHRWAAGV